RLYFDPVWKIRQAVFDAFSRLVQRGILEPGVARQEMNKVLITSYGFMADYPLKQSYNNLLAAIDRSGDKGG
ncbi:MAG: hypothetical protein GXP49_08835, partial [Deltaproteobacteria bacterium]|nr:hypothetical protein [Deltaproteobacteria bacterium]